MSSVYPRKTKVVDSDPVPVDSNIPDNYVAHTLKTEKALPPITWANWWKELNWLSFTILTVTPTIGIIGAMFTKLRWETLLFSIFYYYVTGLGNFFSTFVPRTSHSLYRYHGWLPSPLGSPLLQCLETSSILPRCCGRWCSRGFYQMVVARSPCSPPVH